MQNHADIFDSKSFAEAVKERRVSAARSLEALASEIGVGAATLCRVEGAKMMPDLATYLRICKWLNVSTEKFVKLS